MKTASSQFFHQERTTPHFGAAAQIWLDHQFPAHWKGCQESTKWMPGSPDLTPDFLSVGPSESHSVPVKIHDTGHLKLTILEACSKITANIFYSVHTDWERRLRLCVAHSGEHFEHM